jgi:uncharacterized membrane-anchored protein
MLMKYIIVYRGVGNGQYVCIKLGTVFFLTHLLYSAWLQVALGTKVECSMDRYHPICLYSGDSNPLISARFSSASFMS